MFWVSNISVTMFFSETLEAIELILNGTSLREKSAYKYKHHQYLKTTVYKILAWIIKSSSGFFEISWKEPASWWIVLRNFKSCFPKSTKGKYQNNEGDFHYNPKHPLPLSVLNHLRKMSIRMLDNYNNMLTFIKIRIMGIVANSGLIFDVLLLLEKRVFLWSAAS